MDSRITKLESVISLLPDRPTARFNPQAVAKDLVRKAKIYDMSAKQWELIERLTAQATEPSERPNVNVGSPQTVATLLAKADKSRLQYPNLQLWHKDGDGNVLGAYRLNVASNGQYPGSVQIKSMTEFVTKDNGQQSRRWLGRILNDGSLHSIKDAPSLMAQFLTSAMQDPIASGKKAGRCCFCSIELTDKESLERGYGSTCAANWGLPYGQPKAASGLRKGRTTKASKAAKQNPTEDDIPF